MRMAMVTLLLATMGLSCSDGIPEEFISEDEAYRMGLESAKWRGLLGDPILCGAEFMTLKEMDALRGGHTNPEFAPSHVWMVAFTGDIKSTMPGGAGLGGPEYVEPEWVYMGVHLDARTGEDFGSSLRTLENKDAWEISVTPCHPVPNTHFSPAGM